MAHYYFHFRDKPNYTQDFEGATLPDLAAAIQQAEAASREMIAERILSNEVIGGERFEIADASGVILATVVWRNVIRIEHGTD